MSKFFQKAAKWALPKFGPRLVKVFGSKRVADWIRNYAAIFNTEGTAILWPDAPWFNTYDAGDEEDCVLHPANTCKPREYYGRRGWLPRWVVAIIRTQDAFFAVCRWLYHPRLPRFRRHSITDRPLVERDRYDCAED